MSRPDQIRDRDAIQRDCISAFIDPARLRVKTFGPDPDGEYHLRLCEPADSMNGDNAKFDLRFSSWTEIWHFAELIRDELPK